MGLQPWLLPAAMGTLGPGVPVLSLSQPRAHPQHWQLSPHSSACPAAASWDSHRGSVFVSSPHIRIAAAFVLSLGFEGKSSGLVLGVSQDAQLSLELQGSVV